MLLKIYLTFTPQPTHEMTAILNGLFIYSGFMYIINIYTLISYVLIKYIQNSSSINIIVNTAII